MMEYIMSQMALNLLPEVVLIQQCFDTPDGYKVCNLVRRGYAKKLTATKSGRWWKFPLLKRYRKKNEKQGDRNALPIVDNITVT